MENNQEYKTDKIFKDLLDNQSVTPPVDTWMAIHAYTIGQEKSKKIVWLRYTSLALLLLLFSGLGLWYFVDNQVSFNDKVVSSNTPKVLSQGLLVENGNNEGKSFAKITTSENSVRVLNPNSVKTSNRIVQGNFSQPLQTPEKIIIRLLPKLLSNEEFVRTKTSEKQPLTVEIIEDSLINDNIEFVEPVYSFNKNKIKEIESKPLVFNDLSDKMRKELEARIVAIQGVFDDRNAKTDTIEYRKKLSLRNPIITIAGGNTWNYWNIEREIPLFGGAGKTNLNNPGITIKLGIAWKINDKLRLGVSVSHNNIKLTDGTNYFYEPNNSENENLLKIKANKSLLNQFYTSLSPFGGNINVDSSPLLDLDPIFVASVQFTTYHVPYSMQTGSVSLTSNYSFFSKFRKKLNELNYQVYLLSDLSFQRQLKYFYTKRQFINIPTVGFQEYGTADVYQENNHLQNASEFVLGLRAGLGFRYQFARKLDFYVEGSGQHSLNNWVKSDDIKTFQRSLSLQAGINFNL